MRDTQRRATQWSPLRNMSKHPMVFKKSKQSGTSWAAVPYEKSTPIIEACTTRQARRIGRPYETNHIPQCKITHTKRAVTDRSLICTAFKNNRKNSFNDKFNIKKNIPTFYVLHIHIHPIVKRQITAAVRLPKARQTGRNKQSLHLI